MPGDKVSFTNEDNNESILVDVVFVHHYPSVREMLQAEGVENVLSSEPKNIEHGIKSYPVVTGV